MKHRIVNRLIAFFVIATFVFQLYPDSSFAAVEEQKMFGPFLPGEVDYSLEDITGVSSDLDDIPLLDPDGEPYVQNEVSSLREEDAKHFRLSDGSMAKAMYTEPVHFKQDGRWRDIDNSLGPVPADEKTGVWRKKPRREPGRPPERYLCAGANGQSSAKIPGNGAFSVTGNRHRRNLAPRWRKLLFQKAASPPG